jgi:hypothetical protein
MANSNIGGQAYQQEVGVSSAAHGLNEVVELFCQQRHHLILIVNRVYKVG